MLPPSQLLQQKPLLHHPSLHPPNHPPHFANSVTPKLTTLRTVFLQKGKGGSPGAAEGQMGQVQA